MTYSITIEEKLGDDRAIAPASTATSDQPSAIELLSYGVCCAAQGIIGILYLALVVFVPLAISQGLLKAF